MNGVLLVGVGGAAGAVARYLVGAWLPSTVATTLTVNVAGSFGLGLVVALRPADALGLALGAGFCGAFTTFSSFAVEVVRLYEDGQKRTAVAYGLGMAITAIGAVVLGGAIGAALG